MHSKYKIMLIAQKLRKQNIAEYLLYMWQVEDLLRANNLDVDQVDQNLVQQYKESESVTKEIREWYESLIEMMRMEGVQQEGHLAINNNVITNLTDLHLRLLKSIKHSDYSAVYYKTLPYIVELRSKAGDKQMPEIETCFTALYGFMLVKMQNKEVSGETQAAITQISNLLRLLASKFHQEENDELKF